jgi:glycosyltransferase involved in cell wall biosynthesis
MTIDLYAVIILILIIVNALIACAWVYFIASTARSFRNSPRLAQFFSNSNSHLKVSVIMPARNEESCISNCIKSLLGQNYVNFEVIAVNDSSTDRTLDIMVEMSRDNNELIVINAPPKPDDWVGKNWACYQGYLKASGDILFFTDADTLHSPFAMSSALGLMIEENLDAISAIPRLRCRNILTKITLPVLSIFLHSRYAPGRVNNPKTNIGYFFGSFYLITKTTYEAIGTHKAVRSELIEDGELGRKVKELNYKLKLVRGEHHIEAEWARDSKTLWHALKRLIMPLYSKQKRSAVFMMVFLFFILVEPFIGLVLSIGLAVFKLDLIALFLLGITSTSVLLITIGSTIQSKYALLQNSLYGLCAVGGCLVITACFIVSIFARGQRIVVWKDRNYQVG